jgi:predicted RNase H-like HicB family nuclease
MKFNCVIEQCPDTGLYVGHVPNLAGAHTQGETLEEVRDNLGEVIQMLLEDGPPGDQPVLVPTPKPPPPDHAKASVDGGR